MRDCEVGARNITGDLCGRGGGGVVEGGGGLSSRVIMQSMQTLKMINTTTRLVSDIVTTSSCGKITCMQQTVVDETNESAAS